MSEPNYIKCHIYTTDGKVKDYDINPDSFSFDYMKYLYKGELYFQERLKNGKPDNKVIYKEDFDGLVNSATKKQANSVREVCCPKCGCQSVSFQREQSYNIGAHTNKVYFVPAKKSHSCFYWILIGWWWKPIYWICIGWWYKPLFGRRNKGGIGFIANKTINHTVAVCQNCGYTWKI